MNKIIVAALLLIGCATPQIRDFTAKKPLPESNQVVLLMEEIGPDEAQAMIMAIRNAKKEGKELTIKIDSFGGSVYAGFDIMHEIEDYPTDVTCIVDTKAMSMGFYILESCDKRLMTKRAQLMAHEPSLQMRGNAEQLENSKEALRVLTTSLVEQCAKRMNMTAAQILEKIKDGKEWYMDYRDALEVEAIDGIIDPMDIPVATKPRVPGLFDLLLGR